MEAGDVLRLRTLLTWSPYHAKDWDTTKLSFLLWRIFKMIPELNSRDRAELLRISWSTCCPLLFTFHSFDRISNCDQNLGFSLNGLVASPEEQLVEHDVMTRIGVLIKFVVEC